MKDSGIAWVGEIPDNWETVKLKFLLAKNDGGVWGEDPKEFMDNNTVLRSTEQTVEGYWDISSPAQRYLGNIYNLSFYLIKKDDLLITKSSGSSLHIGKTTLATKEIEEKKYYYSNFLQRLHTKKELLASFLWRILNTNCSREQFVYMQNSTSGIGNINAENINNLIIPLTSIFEQQKIADYLDGKCGEIDGLINDIKTQIETLEQYKRSVITEAVTKGLNKSAPLKDSGITWIGTIPKNWKCVKGKYLFAQRNLRGNKIELQLLSPSQRFGVIPQTVYEELTTQVVVKVKDNTNLSLFKTVHKGDFCISLRSFQGGFEYSAYEGVVSPAYTIFYPIINICDGYYKRLFKENSFIEIINSYALSLRDGKNISFEDFGKTYIPYPPINEQKQIADYLDKKCAEIDKIISDKQSQIETLEEYKKSLIFEYVTGKKQVG